MHFQRPVTAKQFKSNISPGGVTKKVPGLGNLAYSNVIGSGQYASVTLYVLEGTTEFWVGAFPPLKKVEVLAVEDPVEDLGRPASERAGSKSHGEAAIH